MISTLNELPRIDVVSRIGEDGISYITVITREPSINERDLYEGGEYICFELNHRKQTTTAYLMCYCNGVPRSSNDWKPIGVWRSEILVESECLNFAKEMLACEIKLTMI